MVTATWLVRTAGVAGGGRTNFEYGHVVVGIVIRVGVIYVACKT